MVTIYLAGTNIRLESKMAVSEYALEKYKMFKEEMPKEFSISKTRRGCFAYLNQCYTGSDVVAQAANLEDENGKIVARLAKMKTEDELNLNSCVRILKGCGHNLLADWVYGKLATTLEKQGEQKSVEQSADDLPEFESYLCLMFQKFRTKGMCTNGEIIDYVKEHSQKLRDILVKQQRLTDEQLKSLQEVIDRGRQLYK